MSLKFHHRSALVGLCALASGLPLAGALAATPPLPAEILVPGTGIYPAGLTSTPDGTDYIGSSGKGQVLRAKPGSTRTRPSPFPWNRACAKRWPAQRAGSFESN